MKVIVTGATGTAGKGIVKACLADQRIEKILILTRRAVAKDVEADPKVEVILHDDFSQYPEELMAKLEGAEACLWAIGGRVDQFNHDKVLARKVGVDYTLAGAQAMHTHLAHSPSLPDGKKFRFIFCSGMLAEWDQDRRLFFLNDSRKIKGAIEKALSELADGPDDSAAQKGGGFELWIARPSGLLGDDAGLHKKIAGPLYGAIGTEQLGRAMIKMAVEGPKERIIENDKLLKM